MELIFILDCGQIGIKFNSSKLCFLSNTISLQKLSSGKPVHLSHSTRCCWTLSQQRRKAGLQQQSLLMNSYLSLIQD